MFELCFCYFLDCVVCMVGFLSYGSMVCRFGVWCILWICLGFGGFCGLVGCLEFAFCF